MKTLFALTIALFATAANAQFASARAFVPGGECNLEGQRKYVETSATTDDVYVCEAGAWQYLFTRDRAENQD